MSIGCLFVVQHVYVRIAPEAAERAAAAQPADQTRVAGEHDTVGLETQTAHGTTLTPVHANATREGHTVSGPGGDGHHWNSAHLTELHCTCADK